MLSFSAKSQLSEDDRALSAGRLSVKSIALIGLMAGLLLFAVDVPILRYLTSTRPRGFFRDLMNAVEVFGNGFGVAFIVLAIALLDPLRRKAIPWIAACTFGAGMAANFVKMMVLRERPRVVDLASADVWDTFGGLLPLASAGSNGQSFPSAHTATAAGLAVALCYFYPRGKWLFAALTLGVGFQRVFASSHFPSDVVIGGTLGFVVAWSLLKSRPSLEELIVIDRPELVLMPAEVYEEPEERRAA